MRLLPIIVWWLVLWQETVYHRLLIDADGSKNSEAFKQSLPCHILLPGSANPVILLLSGSWRFPMLGSSSLAQWTPQAVDTKARLRGLSVVNDKIVWASGTGGTFVRTANGGSTWKAGIVAGASELDFRDVHAVDDRKACLLSIGEGEKSRIYQTTDGGKSWTLQFRNPDPKGFLDALAFWD